MLRAIGIALGLLFAVVGEPARAIPQTKLSSQEVLVPFDPPLGQNLSYRWEKTDTKDGKTTMSWSLDRFRFEEAGEGYKLIVEPVSSGSNETDPVKLQMMKRLEEMIRMPFVLRLNAEAEIVELERGDEYWAKIMAALREALANRGGRPAVQEGRAIAAILDMFQKMPAEARLAKLTESVQPLVEFAYTKTSVRSPIRAQVDTASPFGGTLKQDVVISLTKVEKGFAHLTVRMNVPREELLKLTAAMVSRLQNGVLDKDQVAKLNAGMAALKEVQSETIADYRISTEDGMLESFRSTQTISVTEGDKKEQRVRTMSLTRVE